MMPVLFTLAGTCFVALGLVGVVLPVLPTTPFLLLAAGCYARSSPQLHTRLLESRLFGPMIRDWQAHRAVARRAKVTAVVMIVTSISLSIVFAMPNLYGQLALAAIGAGVIAWLLHLPTRV